MVIIIAYIKVTFLYNDVQFTLSYFQLIINIKSVSPKLEGKNSDVITKIIIKPMKKLPQLKTMTFDNDLAFVQRKKKQQHRVLKSILLYFIQHKIKVQLKIEMA